jgi:hypothetical protein
MTTSNLSGAIDNAFIDRADIKQYIGLCVDLVSLIRSAFPPPKSLNLLGTTYLVIAQSTRRGCLLDPPKLLERAHARWSHFSHRSPLFLTFSFSSSSSSNLFNPSQPLHSYSDVEIFRSSDRMVQVGTGGIEGEEERGWSCSEKLFELAGKCQVRSPSSPSSISFMTKR